MADGELARYLMQHVEYEDVPVDGAIAPVDPTNAVKIQLCINGYAKNGALGEITIAVEESDTAATLLTRVREALPTEITAQLAHVAATGRPLFCLDAAASAMLADDQTLASLDVDLSPLNLTTIYMLPIFSRCSLYGAGTQYVDEGRNTWMDGEQAAINAATLDLDLVTFAGASAKVRCNIPIFSKRTDGTSKDLTVSIVA